MGPRVEAVIDTNAVLALWWFKDPEVATLRSAVEARAVRWLFTPCMQAELVFVLDRLSSSRPLMADDTAGPSRAAGPVLSALERWGNRVAEPQVAPARRLWCTDADDQVFIDLAVSVPARWLVSRDRALLRLGRRAGRLGIKVCTPEAWQPDA